MQIYSAVACRLSDSCPKVSMMYRTILLAILFTWAAESHDCVPRKFEYDSIVCVCNATYCDSTPDTAVPEVGNFNWYVSSRDGLRMSFSNGKFADDPTNMNGINITVDRTKTYQSIIGFGGAFSDSTGMNIMSLSKYAQDLLLESYFGQEGNRYNLGRVPIGCTDFSVRFYTYDDVVNDTTLEHFQLAKEDFQYKLPIIKRAKKLSPKLKLVSAAWTPPLWMKTSNTASGPSLLKKEHYQTYADYILKFLRTYKSHGAEIWAVSTGNEPIDSFVPGIEIPNMGWTPFGMADWLVNNLAPTIVNSELNNTYILALDDQRYVFAWFVNSMCTHKNACEVVNCFAFHWYFDEYMSAHIQDRIHVKYPNKCLIMTEASIGFEPYNNPKVQLGAWLREERYILEMIENFRHWVTGWIDWNLALDKDGSPNWVKNFVDGTIIVNPETDEFFKQPMYYMIKHFSRFIERNSVRIDSSEEGDIKSVAFETPSKTIVVILYNKSSKENNVAVQDSKRGTIKINLPPYSIHTIEYK